MFNEIFTNARAIIKGGKDFSKINGNVYFQQTSKGVIVTAKIYNLPTSNRPCESRIFGFHIHSGTSCTGDSEDEFKNALGHYNSKNCKHPHHAGDLPPLFENNGYAYLSFLTNRFNVRDIIDRVVIIHSNLDDFTTDPSGNSRYENCLWKNRKQKIWTKVLMYVILDKLKATFMVAFSLSIYLQFHKSNLLFLLYPKHHY